MTNKYKSKYAPIAIFIYKRPEHTQKTIESLNRCKEIQQSNVYVFCDGPKSFDEKMFTDKARAVAHQLLDKNATYVECESNNGLGKSLISGVTEVCNEHGKVIVVEDDLVLSDKFLGFMNKALNEYANEPKVMQIAGYNFSIPKFQESNKAFFLPFTSSWGWATWKKSWKSFDKYAKGWETLKEDEHLRFKFNIKGSIDYFQMLKDQMAGKIDSWAIRWYWSVFKNRGLVLYPPKSLVSNIGFDGSGTHGWRSAKRMSSKKESTHVTMPIFPKEISCDEFYLDNVSKYFNTQKRNILRKIHNSINRILLRR